MKARFFAMAAAVTGLSLGLVSCPAPGAPKPSTTTREVLDAVYQQTTPPASFIMAYTINETTGALTPVTGSPVAAGNGLIVATTSAGRLAYVADPTANSVMAFHVNAFTGLPTLARNSTFGVQNLWVTADGNARFLFVSVPSSSLIVSVFAINQVTGDLTPVGNSGTLTTAPIVVAVHPSGSYLYATDGATNVYGFGVDPGSGFLTPIPGSPFGTVGANLAGIAIDPKGNYLYVADRANNTVAAFSIDQISGSLTPMQGSPYATSGLATYLAIDPQGRFLYSAEDGSASPIPSTITGFKIDPTTGALSIAPGFPLALPGLTATIPTIDPSGRFLYAGDSFGSGNQFHAYRMDQTTGALYELPGSPYAIAGADSISMLSASTVTVPGQ